MSPTFPICRVCLVAGLMLGGLGGWIAGPSVLVNQLEDIRQKIGTPRQGADVLAREFVPVGTVVDNHQSYEWMRCRWVRASIDVKGSTGGGLYLAEPTQP